MSMGRKLGTLLGLDGSVKAEKLPSGGGSGGVTVYADLIALSAVVGTAGDMALVQDINKMFVYTGTGWFVIATVTNGTPSAISGVDGSYSLSTDGTPTVITAVSTDPEGFPLTWNYAVTTGSLGSTATVSQVDNVFTITPSANEVDAGGFSITFSVTDGVTGLLTNLSQFSLDFFTELTCYMWGAGGAGGYAGDGTGGGGGSAVGVFKLESPYSVVVGEGGNSRAASAGVGPSVVGGGGYTGNLGYGGGGGGYTGVFLGSVSHANSVLIAGGGGGASYEGRDGGAGGGSDGIAGENALSAGGGGGSQVSGGSSPSNAGSALLGGSSGSEGDGGGSGGGGGGYYGGGAGSNLNPGSAGGGGSGYFEPSINATLYGGSGTTSGNNAEPLWTGFGTGGSAGNNPGQPGGVIFKYFGSVIATGGTITNDGTYTYHTFTSSGTLASYDAPAGFLDFSYPEANTTIDNYSHIVSFPGPGSGSPSWVFDGTQLVMQQNGSYDVGFYRPFNCISGTTYTFTLDIANFPSGKRTIFRIYDDVPGVASGSDITGEILAAGTSSRTWTANFTGTAYVMWRSVTTNTVGTYYINSFDISPY